MEDFYNMGHWKGKCDIVNIQQCDMGHWKDKCESWAGGTVVPKVEWGMTRVVQIYLLTTYYY